MFPAATAVTVARNVARRGVLSHFCLCVQVLLSLATFSHGLSVNLDTLLFCRKLVRTNCTYITVCDVASESSLSVTAQCTNKFISIQTKDLLIL